MKSYGNYGKLRDTEFYSTTAIRRDAVRAATRYLHRSCEAGMRPNPLDPLMPWVPYVILTGGTYRHSEGALP